MKLVAQGRPRTTSTSSCCRSGERRAWSGRPFGAASRGRPVPAGTCADGPSRSTRAGSPATSWSTAGGRSRRGSCSGATTTSVQGPFVRPYLDDEGKLVGRFAALLIEAPDGLDPRRCGARRRSPGSSTRDTCTRNSPQLGVRPWDIRIVVITHGHADHVGGLLGPRREPAFPDARHVIHRREADFWASDGGGRASRRRRRPASLALHALLAADLLDLIGEDVDVARRRARDQRPGAHAGPPRGGDRRRAAVGGRCGRLAAERDASRVGERRRHGPAGERSDAARTVGARRGRRLLLAA